MLLCSISARSDGQAIRVGVARSRSIHESMALGHKSELTGCLCDLEEWL